MRKNCAIAQSGGPTAVINASAVGVMFEAFRSEEIDRVYALVNGITGAFGDNFFCLNDIDPRQLKRLKTTPSSALGSCRYRLADASVKPEEYKTIFSFFERHNIGYFFYIGGNDSMDTVLKLDAYAKAHHLDVKIIGIPKTIDNDLAMTDHCPGYGSAAKYIATSLLEIHQDAKVYQTDLITVVEVMGRNAGWLAAAGALPKFCGKHIVDFIYLPEVDFDMDTFLADVRKRFEETRNVLIVVSEGIHDAQGNYLMNTQSVGDQFGHQQLGGAGQVLRQMLMEQITPRVKCVEFNILQRCAAHCLSETDVEEAYKMGKEAVHYADAGHSGVMVGIERVNNANYLIRPVMIPVELVAGKEKTVPLDWITPGKNFVTKTCIDYIAPLIVGEKMPEYEDGLPVFTTLDAHAER